MAQFLFTSGSCRIYRIAHPDPKSGKRKQNKKEKKPSHNPRQSLTFSHSSSLKKKEREKKATQKKTHQ
ncbi:unnamed protein product [Tuber melanosporum]|uniref:(Perigord truffle) hypothetical protein n=1 Tax=Tuber melanosporum (strain Mel28) TaxID=656061 RepID=D5G6S6_TUBMM|nr:uncharacterized protein GSTUM_00002248001 [Tuber melanosporum]CAZ80219.1 unnamed protein product [Tuber melanosporum]